VEPKFKPGDRVVVLGHPTGLLRSYDLLDTETGANYIKSMDSRIGKEFVIHHSYKVTRNGYKEHYRYRLDNDNCYWIEDWIDFAEAQVDCPNLEIANLL
jgi:hypothetical protein